MTKNFLLVIMIALLTPLSLQAQEAEAEAVVSEEKIRDILYVTDRLRLSVYPQADSKSGTLQLLNSGDKLAILQISGNYALVITPSGKQGWVKRGFLVSEPTASLLLEEEKKKNEQLSGDIEKLGNSKLVIDQYEKDMDALTENIQALKIENDQASNTITELKQAAQEKAKIQAAKDALLDSNEALPMMVLKTTAISYWRYLVPIAVLFILAGFLIGKLFTESRIRRRFHGIKIW
jgi:SH3 domain protein